MEQTDVAEEVDETEALLEGLTEGENGWYEFPDGTKVHGKAAAVAEVKARLDAASNESVLSEADQAFLAVNSLPARALTALEQQRDLILRIQDVFGAEDRAVLDAAAGTIADLDAYLRQH